MEIASRAVSVKLDFGPVGPERKLPWRTCTNVNKPIGLAQKGESLYKISALMGNSPEICRKHYAALIPEKMSEVVEFPQNEKIDKSEDDTKIILREILRELKESKEPKSEVPYLRLVKPTDSA